MVSTEIYEAIDLYVEENEILEVGTSDFWYIAKELFGEDLPNDLCYEDYVEYE